MPCSHEDCSIDPRWRPVLELRSRPRAVVRRLDLLQLGYCDTHKRTVTLTTLLSDEGFDLIVKKAREAGKEKLDRRHTTLGWHLMTRRELYFLRKNQHRTTTPIVDEDTDLAF